MSKFYEEIMQGLEEVIVMGKGEIPVVERKNMPALTFVVADIRESVENSEM